MISSSLSSISVTHKMTNHISLIRKLINGRLHSPLSILWEAESFNDFPPAIFTEDWIGEAKTFWYSILSGAHDGHASPLAVGAVDPVTDMIHCSITSRNCTWQPSQRNNLSASLLHSWNKFIISPFFSCQISNLFTLKRAITQIWEHCSRMISPHTKFLYITTYTTEFKNKLSNWSILVQSC